MASSSTNDTVTRTTINGDLPTCRGDEEGPYSPDNMLSPFGPPIIEVVHVELNFLAVL